MNGLKGSSTIAKQQTGSRGGSYTPFKRGAYGYAIGQKVLYVSNDPVGSEISPDKLAIQAPRLGKGDRIRFKCGQSYSIGDLAINPGVRVEHFGFGDAPEIDGSISISENEWTLDSGSIYYTTLTQTPKQVFIGGLQANWAQTAYIVVTARGSDTTVTADTTTLNNLNAAESLIGSFLAGKEFPFRPTFLHEVTNYSAGVLTLIDSISYLSTSLAAGMPFKLFGHKSFITDVGEWSFDASTSRLYVKTSGASPKGTDIRISVNDYGFIPQGDDIQIKHLTFKHQYLGGIYSVSNNDLVVQDVTFRDIIIHGADFLGNSRNVKVLNSRAYNINNNAINIGGIKSGLFDDITMDAIGEQSAFSYAYYPDLFRSVGCGIHSRWDLDAETSVMENVTISNCWITNVGYIGIVFCGRNNVIEKNYVDTFCTTWNDGGGIYCIDRLYGTNPATENCTIRNNIVKNGFGDLTGVTSSTLLHAEGIYLDNNSAHITVDGNQVEKVTDYGILVNFHTFECTITDNNVVDAENAQIAFVDYPSLDNGSIDPAFATVYADAIGHVCTGNVMGCRETAQVCMEVRSNDAINTYNPFSAGGNSDNNRYIRPHGVNVNRFVGSATTLYTLAGWQTLLSEDTSSSAIANTLTYSNQTASELEIKFDINSTEADYTVTLDANYTDAGGTPVTSQNVPAFSGVVSVSTISRGISLLEDTYTGTAVGIESHTCDVGGPWVEETGTISIDGSGKCIATVVGDKTFDCDPYLSITVETLARQTVSNSGLNLLFRYTDSDNYIAIQFLVHTTATSARTFIIDRVAGVSTIVYTQTGVTWAPNVDYVVKGELIGNTMKVFVNNVLQITYTNALFGDHASTKHGLRINTTAQHDRTSILR